jgi:hypothetical protein
MDGAGVGEAGAAGAASGSGLDGGDFESNARRRSFHNTDSESGAV